MTDENTNLVTAEVTGEELPAETTEATVVESEPAASDSVVKTDEPAGAESEEEAGEEPASGKKGGFQRKIDKLAEENEKLKRQLQTVMGVPETNGAPTEKPKVDDFEDYDSYLEALASWHLDTKTRQQAAELREHLVRQEQEALLTAFKAQSSEFHKANPDYLDVLKSVDDIQVPPAVQQMLLAVDNGPALMYELAKDRDALTKLMKLPPMSVAIQIGALSAELKQRKSTPPVTRAAAPLKPLGTSSPSTGKSPEDMTMAEYKAWRTAH